MVKEAIALGKPQVKSDDTMTFDYFLETSKIVFKYTMMQCQEGLKELAAQRRDAIKNNDDQKFNQMILETSNWEQMTHSLIQAQLYQAVKVKKTTFEKSMRTYLLDPQKRSVYEEEIAAVREANRTDLPRELTRDEVISSVRLLEQAKLDAQKKMYEFVRSQKVPHNMINAVIKVEKLKADDNFFLTTGIEEEDVEPSIKRLDLEKDEEYQEILSEFKKKSEEFLKEKQKEAQFLIQQAAAMRARGRGGRGMPPGAQGRSEMPKPEASETQGEKPNEATADTTEPASDSTKEGTSKQGSDPVDPLAAAGNEIW